MQKPLPVGAVEIIICTHVWHLLRVWFEVHSPRVAALWAANLAELPDCFAPGDTFLTGTSSVSSARLKVLRGELTAVAAFRAGIPVCSLLESARREDAFPVASAGQEREAGEVVAERFDAIGLAAGEPGKGTR